MDGESRGYTKGQEILRHFVPRNDDVANAGRI